MAYRAEIEIGVRGQERLNKLQNQISQLANKITRLNDESIFDPVAPRAIQSIQNYSNAVSVAAANLREAALGTREETSAVRQYVQALGEANAARARQNSLVAQELANQRRVTPGNAGFGQQGPALPPSIVRAQQVKQSWGKFFNDAVELVVDLQQTTAVKRVNTKSSWNRFFTDAADLAVDLKTDSAAHRLNIQNSWNKFFNDAAQVAIDLQNALVIPAALREKRATAILETARKRRLAGATQYGPEGARPAGTLGAVTSSSAMAASREVEDLVRNQAQQRIEWEQKVNGISTSLQKQLNSLRVKHNAALYRLEQRRVKKIAAEEEAAAKASAQRRSGAISNALIGGAFPLLFGQGAIAAAGGGIGGLAGGLLGGTFGFGLSLVGTAIGDAIQKTVDLEKAITDLNTKFMDTSAQTRITYTDIENLAKALKITKEEAVDAVKEFAGYGKSALALTQAFSGLGGAATFETIASAGTSEKSALQAIVQLRSLIGVEAAKNLLTNLKNNGALGTQEKLLDLILEKQFDVNTEAAKQINPWDRTRELIAQSLALVYKLIDSLKDIKLPLPSLPGLPEFKFGLDFLDLSKPIADLESVTAESLRDQRMSDIFKLRDDIITSLDTETDLQTDINNLQKEYNRLSKQDAAKRAAEAARDLTERLQRQLELATAKTEKDRTTLRILFEYRDNLKAIQRLEDQSQSAQQLKLANDLYSLALHKQTADELDRYLKTLVAIVDKGPALGMQAFSGGPFGAPVQDLTGLAFGTQGTFAKVSPAEETLLRAKKSLEDLLEPANQAQVIAQGIGTAFTDSFKSVIDGSATAQEALANMFNRIADAFFDMAAQIITQLLVIKAIESAISFFGGGATAKSFSGAGPYSYPSNLNIPFTIPGKAMGGPVSAGSPYVVGERGPELFVPGKSGTIVPNSSLGGANVVVNVDASGSKTQGNQAEASALGRAIGAAVQAELVKQKRPGGLLA